MLFVVSLPLSLCLSRTIFPWSIFIIMAKLEDFISEAISCFLEERELDEKAEGLWHNIHKRRKAGKKPKSPGEEGYPKTLDIEESESKKPIGKPMRTPGESKKFKVYVKDPKTKNIKTVRFGDPNMEIKRDSSKRRKNFRSRHNCDNPGPRTKARYWSCRQWRKGSKVED